MKTAIIIFVVMFALSVESGSHKKHKSGMKASEASEDDQWPRPDVIRNFEIPPEFTASPTVDDNDGTTAAPVNHGKAHHKSHSN